jgi:hypothetical protein
MNLDVYFTGGQPSRGLELGSIKYQNTESTSRNVAISNGEVFVASEYNKARASTNYSFHVVRYLPKPVAILVVLYLIYIRPFAKMLFDNTQSSQKKIKVKRIVRSVSKQAGQRRKKPRMRSVSKKDDGDEAIDVGYIFSSDESPNKCWTGVELSEILQEESRQRLNVKINLWAWRHIIIGITKTHLEAIAPFFAKDEKACKEQLETNIYKSIFAWQAGHQSRINTSIYGLDAAFPGRIQPALLRFYRQISRIWHHWLGLLEMEEGSPSNARDNGKKRGPPTNDDEQEKEDGSPARKRPKTVNSEIQTTPKKQPGSPNTDVEDSPLTQDWIQKKQKAEKLVKDIEKIITARRQKRKST